MIQTGKAREERFFDLHEKKAASWLLTGYAGEDKFILHKLMPVLFRRLKTGSIDPELHFALDVTRLLEVYSNPSFSICKLFSIESFMAYAKAKLKNKDIDGEITQKVRIDHIDTCLHCQSLANKAIDLYQSIPTDAIDRKALDFIESEFWREKREDLVAERLRSLKELQSAQPLRNAAIVFIGVAIIICYTLLTRQSRQTESAITQVREVSRIKLLPVQKIKTHRTQPISIILDSDQLNAEWQNKLSLLEAECLKQRENNYLSDYDRSFTRDPQQSLYSIFTDSLTKYLKSRSITDYKELEGIAEEIAAAGDQTALEELKEIESINTESFLQAQEKLASMSKLSSTEEKKEILNRIKTLQDGKFEFLYLSQDLLIAPINARSLKENREIAGRNRRMAEWCIYGLQEGRDLLNQSRFNEALPLLAEVAEVSRQIGFYDTLTRALILLSNTYSVTDQHTLTLKYAFDLLQVSAVDQRISAATNIALSLYALGYKKLALYTLDLAEQLRGPAHNRINARAIKAELLALEGKSDQSIKLINEVWLQVKLLDSRHNGYILGRLARTKAILGDWLGAEVLYREAIVFAEANYSESYLALAQLYQGIAETSDHLMNCKQSKEYIEKAITNWDKAKELLPYKQNQLLNFGVTDKSPREVKICLG